MSDLNKKFFISTAIDYPSDKAHIGHSLEKVQADVIARYKRLQGFEVHFSTGTDEHGLKIQRKAEEAGKNPKEFVDEMSKYFKDAWEFLNISYDDFIRTTDKKHEKVVQKIFQKIYDKGDIYKGKYRGLYCVDCESYYLAKDLIGGKCPVHKKEPEIIEEETYFFRMSKYQNALIKHIKENENFIVPKGKRNEILNRLKEPLQDLSISRTKVEWGIPVPLDKKFTIFVWVDALINYLTTIGYPNREFETFWPADVHVIGKDIIWHHSVIWGALLLSLGLRLPKTIFVHGFLTVNSQKMSKSIGNVINPIELVKKYGTDPVRYFLLREMPPTQDGDFTYEKFEDRYTADLSRGLGNFVARVITLAQNSKSEILNSKQISSPKFQTIINKTKEEHKKALNEFKFNEALVAIWKLIGFCDKHIEQTKPWEKNDGWEDVIKDLLLALSHIAKMLEPFLPETSEKIIEQLKTKESKSLFPRLIS